jgi:hypothetical protein
VRTTSSQHTTSRTTRPSQNKIIAGHTRGLRITIVRDGGFGRIPDTRDRRKVLAAMKPSETVTSNIQAACLFSLGWFIQARRSELSAMNWNDLARTVTGMHVRFRQSKTDQEGQGAVIHITEQPNRVCCPVATLNAWRTHLEQQFGPIDPESAVFRNPHRLGERMQPGAVNDTVHRCATRAGLPGNYTGHSHAPDYRQKPPPTAGKSTEKSSPLTVDAKPHHSSSTHG